MPFENNPLRVAQVDYVCDKCREGRMRPTGIFLSSNPPKFPHRCTSCGDEMVFSETYPTIHVMTDGA